MSTSKKATWVHAPSRTVLLATFAKLATPSLIGNLTLPEWQGVWPIVLPCGNLCLLKAHMHLLFPRLWAPCDDVLTAGGRASLLCSATGTVTGDLSTLDHHSGREDYSCDHSHAVM